MTALDSCPSCGNQAFRQFARDDRLTLVRCLGCHLVYSNPQPRDRVRDKYLHEYDLARHFEQFTTRKRVLYERRRHWLPKPRVGADEVCDVGCGDGQFLNLMRSHGWKTVGIEMNPPAAERAAAGGSRIYQGVIEEIENLPWGRFPLVTSWDSLEHTPEPRVFAERLVRLVAEGGTLAVSTLNLPSLAWHVFGMRWSMVVDDHFTYWDRRSMRALFESLGMTVVREDVFGLGRDFVRSVDHLLGRDTSTAKEVSARRSPEEGPTERGGKWDVKRGVLVLEDALNAVFRLAGGGVGITMVMRRP